MYYPFLFILLILLVLIYRRYVPVPGVPSRVPEYSDSAQKVAIVDLRDYHISAKNPVGGAMPLPVAYLKREIGGITSKNVHLIVSDKLERNLGIRMMRENGFKVTAYTCVK
ncbi:sulfurtransferase [Peribacillus glennii]|uniref:Sulfurtransferase n=1 Tax=Peribacillus glennii TaxID=2303991 RepID=A0A372LF97_9BACI|nr:sulfurtransferase [Peribacillus glennii]RFU64684.1 sulfurtransferase [Peribacillus glennii]